MSQKMALFINTAVRTSDSTSKEFMLWGKMNTPEGG
jgi:hypothetical protein